jgi:hypothetical protein
MATINRYVIPWTGTTALPGVSVLYSTGATDATADIVTFLNAIKGLFPPGLSWSVLNGGDTIDDTTGTLNGSWTGVGGAVVTSTGAGNYAAGTGAFVTWHTPTIVGGRRLKGRTFLCPLTIGSYDATGTIATATLTTISAAGTALAGVGKMRVWHRPPAGGGGGGTSALINAATVPDQVTSLRSRRV